MLDKEGNMKKYHLKNLDCADCAVKIERGLNRLESVESVSINFATASMLLKAHNEEEVLAEIRRIEPEVQVIKREGDRSRSTEEEDPFRVGAELILIGISVVIFVLGMVFKTTLHDTPYFLGEYAVFLTAFFLSGWKVLFNAGRNIIHGKVFDENFLMSIATIGAILIHALPEAAGVMIFFRVGEFFEELSLARSRRSIKSLLQIRPDYANLKRGSVYDKVSPETVQVGNIILVKPGEKVPLDGEVLSGTSKVDTSALTGESVPRFAKQGDTILSGMIVQSGSLTVKVTTSYEESSISKILDLVENAISNKAETEKFMTTFARYYTPVIVLITIGIALLPPLLLPGASFSDWIYRALVVLVISCPCALVISIPLGYFGGIGGASRRGILIKGSNYIDVMAKVKTVVFDKTGTLTKGAFKVTEVAVRNGFTRDDILTSAALAESHSNHPIAESIREAYGREIDEGAVKDYLEISGYGIKASVSGKAVLVGNDKLLHRENIDHDICDVDSTVAHVVIGSRYAGYIIIRDEEKEDAKEAVAELKTLGVKNIAMLTGDSESVARSVAARLGIGTYYAGLLPEDKVNRLTGIMAAAGKNEKVAFVGDGINDAPVIARADVGIAMGVLGSDAAIDTADVVLMTDAPSKIPQAIRTSKKTRTIVYQNIILALTVKLVFVGLGIAGVAGMWEAVFADVGVALLAIFNALRVLK